MPDGMWPTSNVASRMDRTLRWSSNFGTTTKVEVGPDALTPGPEDGGSAPDSGRQALPSSEDSKDEAAESRDIAPWLNPAEPEPNRAPGLQAPGSRSNPIAARQIALPGWQRLTREGTIAATRCCTA